MDGPALNEEKLRFIKFKIFAFIAEYSISMMKIATDIGPSQLSDNYNKKVLII